MTNKKIEPCYRRFGKLLKQCRKAAKMSQQQMADAMALSRGSIANIEAGRQRIMLHDVYGFADVCGVSYRQLFEAFV
jgi:transcriptional regulator with XRE-family HTH domain